MKRWHVTGSSMVVEADTEAEAIDRAQETSGWSWEATRMHGDVILTLESEALEFTDLEFAPDEDEDDEGESLLTMRCPTCLTQDIHEVDRALRWNDLTLDDNGSADSNDWTLEAGVDGDFDFENDGWQCGNLHDISIPGWLWATVTYP